MTIRYLIIEDGEFVGDQSFDREQVLARLPLCKSGAQVWGVVSMPPKAPGEMTKSIIEQGHAEHRWTRAEIENSVLADYITLPLSREEQRADDEERESDWRSGK